MNLSRITLAVAAATLAASAVRAQDRLTPIQYGQQVAGALARGDEQLTDSSYVDEYVFRGRRGDRITLTLRSPAFDTYLALGDYPDNRNWREVAKDDDGAGGTDSRVTLTLPADGRYIIRANSVEPNKLGRYTLQLTATPAPPPAAARPATPAQRPAPATQAAGPVGPGRYGCTRSRYSARSGTYEYDPKGYIELAANGTYRYLGLQQPSPGRYRRDPQSGKITFSGGYLNGGEATPIEGRVRQFMLTAPGIDERWKCGPAD